MDLGTLTGYLNLDDKGFQSTLDSIPGKVNGSGALAKLAAGGAALAIGLAISGGIESAIELDSANAKITAQLGLTEEESARIGGVAGKLYSQAYGESIEDVNTAVQNVVSGIEGMRDATGKALEDMTAKALNFSGAFEIDTARSTQVVGQLIKSGLVADANEGFDLLTAAMQKVPAGVREDIMDAADEYGPFFASMGMDGADAMNLLASSADKGMFGIDKAGDAVKEFGIRATDLNDTGAQDALAALGLSGTDMANQLLAGGDTAQTAMQTIVDGLRGIQDPAAQAAAATALFGTPLEDLGKDSIPGFLDALSGGTDVLGDFTGAADEMGASLNGDMATGWTQLQRTWDSIIGQVGGALLPILSAVVDWLNENPAILGVVAAAVGVLAAAFVIASVAVWAMNSALLANPITWIILAIVALVAAIVLLVMNWDTVVKFMTDVWAGFVGWFTGVMEGFFGWWNGIWAGFSSAVSDIWNGIVNWIAVKLLEIYATVMSVLSNVRSWWDGLWSGLMQGATNVWNGFLSFLGAVPGNIMGFFSGIGRWLWNAGRDLIQGLLDGVKSLAGTIGNFFLGLLPEWIVGPFKAALGIHSPSTVFRGFGRNVVQGLTLGLDDEQRALTARMDGLVNIPEASGSASYMSGAFGGQGAPERPMQVSLAGARVTLQVGQREMDAYVQEHVMSASETRRTQLVVGTGEVVFS